MLKKLVLAAGLAAIAFAVPAQARVQLGVLRCTIDGGVGYVITSNKALDCTYRSSRDGSRERYTGVVTKLGVDVGQTNQGELVWAVFGPSRAYADGALAGSYFGVNAEASVVTGGGLNVLVGGFQNSLNLQPLSAQAQTGLNLAVAVASIDLVHSLN
jgi:hypothetical protein